MSQGMTIETYERLDPAMTVTYNGRQIQFSTPNSVTKWRVETLASKEPDTLEWISGFKPGDVLLDVGANVGMYSILAGAAGCRVFAFEPESQNFAILNRNIIRNNLGDRVTAWCAALTDRFALDCLHVGNFQPGDSCHTFGEALDFKLEPFNSILRQGSVSLTIDSLMDQDLIAFPDHIKIDVDGLEHKVIAGARATLDDPRLKSMLIELHTGLEEHRAIIAIMEAAGFSWSPEEADKAIRKDGAFKGVGNHIFRR